MVRTEKMVQTVCPVRMAQMGKTVKMGVTEEAEARHKALQEQAALLEKEKETCQSQLTVLRMGF